MNNESKINVHHSSLVGLKAELLRKQEEVTAEKVKRENANPTAKTKKIREKKKKNRFEDDKVDESQDIDSMKELHKSKLMLQAKSRLYDKLSKSHVNMNPNFLVDFEHKSNDEKSLEESDKEEDNLNSDYDSDSDGWVEYTDCFGRTRKCLREDLPKMQAKDESVKKEIKKLPENVSDTRSNKLYFEDRMPAKEPELEVMRRKWEEQTEKIANKVNIHYQDILFDEARAHGVGYYAFSQDEEERAKQQENLSKLRKQTEDKQKENQEIRNMKDKIQQNRLKVARLRQRIRAGLPLEEEPSEIITTNEVKSNISELEENSEISKTTIKECCYDQTYTKQSLTKEEVEKNKLKDDKNKIKAFGELLGKRSGWYVMSQEEWVQKKRKERDQEFAPVYENFKSSGKVNLNDSQQDQSIEQSPLSKEVNNPSYNDESIVIISVPPTEEDTDITGSKQIKSQDDSPVIGPMPKMFDNNSNGN